MSFDHKIVGSGEKRRRIQGDCRRSWSEDRARAGCRYCFLSVSSRLFFGDIAGSAGIAARSSPDGGHGRRRALGQFLGNSRGSQTQAHDGELGEFIVELNQSDEVRPRGVMNMAELEIVIECDSRRRALRVDHRSSPKSGDTPRCGPTATNHVTRGGKTDKAVVVDK